VPKKPTQAEKAPSKGRSGATGGPSTARGVDYQLDYAVYHGLALVAEQLGSPHQDLSITIEPRQLNAGDAMRSDIRIAGTRTSIEVKLNPSREDILGWLGRAAAGSANENHELVYATASGTVLSSLAALLRLANEAGDDTEQLGRLAAFENVKDSDVLLLPFGATAATRLNNLALRRLPESVVHENIGVRARVLAPEQADMLVKTLKLEFLQGMKVRRTYSFRSLVQQLQGLGVNLEAPKTLALPNLAAPSRAVLAALQQCHSGLPNQVIAAVAERSPIDTATILQPLIDSRTLDFDGERWRLLVALPDLKQQSAGPLERALTSLLDFISTNEDAPAGRTLVADAVALTRKCAEQAPKAIIYAFRKIEKLLKRIGDKYLVLELAELTIAAASREPRSLEDAHAQAHALICGRSWVYQRTGELDLARSHARTSLDLGEEINWELNTAFCLKCLGRLMRMQAEKMNNITRAELLTASADKIDNAIAQFSGMSEIGPTHPEVGDCFSLLARTYLVARLYEDARIALRRAYELVPQNGSKDHLDLLILTGDLQAATGEAEAADNTYTQALQLPEAADVQKSEIFARGFHQRARLRESLKRTSQAIQDYDRAATLWRELYEFENSARSHWRSIYLSSPNEKPMLDEIANEESFLVRVTAFNLYLERYPGPQAIARRRQPTRQQVVQLLKDARQQAAVRYPRR
jgi:tetratricopeptide (TPR) repeat protein